MFRQQEKCSKIPGVSHGRLQQLQNFVDLLNSLILFKGLFEEACSFVYSILPNFPNENSSFI